jgi:hypothetical protein
MRNWQMWEMRLSALSYVVDTETRVMSIAALTGISPRTIRALAREDAGYSTMTYADALNRLYDLAMNDKDIDARKYRQIL